MKRALYLFCTVFSLFVFQINVFATNEDNDNPLIS